jgi:colanic acid/amylovoran biosynthesis glycosyltransferase
VAQVRRIVAEGGCADRLDWHENQPFDEYIRRTRAAHVFVNPSVVAADGDAEGGCPLTVIELAAAGMPVLGSAHCDIPEAVLDGRSGFIVPERDAAALHERMEHLLLHPEIWPELGRAGRAHVEREYNRKHQPAKLETLYDRLLG